MSFFQKLRDRVSQKTETVTSKFRQGLTKTSQSFVGKVEALVTGRRKIDEEFYEELEEILIEADVGVMTVMELVDELRSDVKERKIENPTELRPLLSEKLVALLEDKGEKADLNVNAEGLTVLMFVGVNGVGKTTTIGKMAPKFK
ncbi:MAG: signal recognition particle receptor subunit alpha, partial [Novibacillus thermophilus]